MVTAFAMIKAGEKLRRARVLRGWTQIQCDEFAQVKIGRTQSYERGSANPSREFIRPLAEAWHIPVDWFFDGEDDSPPSTQEKEYPTLADLPVYAPLPTSRCEASSVFGREPLRVAFQVPPGSHYRRIADTHLSPVLCRGDLILLVPIERAYSDTLVMCQWDHGCDVAEMARNADGDIVARQVSESQRLPVGAPDPPKYMIVEMKRVLGNGVVLAIENHIGLSAETLRQVAHTGNV